MPVRTDPQTAAQRWVQGLQSSGAKLAAGVNAVTQAPGARAAAKVDKYRQGVLDNIPKWERNVRAVSLESWKEAMLTKGASRVASGAQAAEGKMTERLTRLWPFLTNVVNQVDNMPDATLEDRIAKSAAFQRKMALYGQQGG